MPHWLPEGSVLHVTWRLANSLPTPEPEMLLCVLMLIHVHILLEPHIELPVIMRWLKGRTARTANRILGRTDQPFWHDESYDHIIRSSEEFGETVHHIENNPVRAGLVEFASQWQWSSAVDRPQKTMACPTRGYGC